MIQYKRSLFLICKNTNTFIIFILVAYTDKKLNGVGVTMDAWSPKIPQQSRKSAIPTIFYEFTVTNPGKVAIEVCLFVC